MSPLTPDGSEEGGGAGKRGKVSRRSRVLGVGGAVGFQAMPLTRIESSEPEEGTVEVGPRLG